MFTVLFIVFLLADTLLRFWVSWRQLRHVRQHRNEDPAPFAARISLRNHQRAADYTSGGTRLAMVERLVEAAVLVGFTLLGGLQYLDLLMGRLIDNEMLRQLALIGS